MYELTRLGPQSYCIHAGTNAGVWVQDDRAFLFDAGLNDQDAEAFLRVITEQSWTLEAIYNTHYHADHVGGNHYLQEKTGCACYCALPIFATEPELNPSFMLGAYPPKQLRSDVFLAQPSQTQDLTQDVLPDGISMLAIPGHACAQYAFRTADDVLFLGDGVLSEEEIRRHPMSYLYRLDQHLATLNRIEAQQANWYVPSHGEPVREIAPLTACNRAACEQIRSWILEFCAGDGMSQDELLKALFDRMHQHLHFAKYTLYACTLHAYLSDLLLQEKIIARAKANILRYRTV